MSDTSTSIRNNYWLTALADTREASGSARDRLLFEPDVHQDNVLVCDARRVILECSLEGRIHRRRRKSLPHRRLETAKARPCGQPDAP